MNQNNYYPSLHKNKIYNLVRSYCKQYNNMKYNIEDIQEEAFQESCLYYQILLNKLKDTTQTNKYYSKTYQGKLIYHLHFIKIGARNRSKNPLQTVSINTIIKNTSNNTKEQTKTIEDLLMDTASDTSQTKELQENIREFLYKEVYNIRFNDSYKTDMLIDTINAYLIEIDKASTKNTNRTTRYTVNNRINKQLIAIKYNTTERVVRDTFAKFKKHIKKKYQKKSKIFFN